MNRSSTRQVSDLQVIAAHLLIMFNSNCDQPTCSGIRVLDRVTWTQPWTSLVTWVRVLHKPFLRVYNLKSDCVDGTTMSSTANRSGIISVLALKAMFSQMSTIAAVYSQRDLSRELLPVACGIKRRKWNLHISKPNGGPSPVVKEEFSSSSESFFISS